MDARTPLMYAALTGHADLIDLLLQHGAQAGAKDQKGGTALTLALDHQDVQPAEERDEQRLEREARFGRAIRLLADAQPDSAASMALWASSRAQAEREWLLSFRRLYHQLEDCEGPRLYADILRPFIPYAVHTLGGLQHYRRMNTPGNPYQPLDEDLWEWYA